MWMAHASAADTVRRVDFAAARDEGLACLEEIVAEYERELKLPRAELRDYLTENICFDLNEEMRAGLELFFRLAHKHELAPGLRPLKMLGA
jgi:predicted solute-binding protein